MPSNATQKIKNVSFGGSFCQLGETTDKILEAHGFGTQALSGNCPHMSVASADEPFERNAVVDGTTSSGQVNLHGWIV